MSRALLALPLVAGACTFTTVHRVDPWEPVATPSRDSDFILVRTRDQNHFYLIDPARRLCFLHTRLYGQEHLVPIDCERFPGYDQVVAEDAARRGPRAAPMDAPPDALPADAPPDALPADAPVDVADDEERPEDQAFRRAWVRLECSRREGAEEPVDVVIERFQLSREAWDQGIAALSDDDRAVLLEDANATCPPEPAAP